MNEGAARLNEPEKVEYDDGIKQLGQWIDESELEGLMKKWNALCQKLEAKKGKMQKLFEKYKKQQLWKKIAIGLGGGSCIDYNSHNINVCGKTLVTAHLIGTGMGLGAATLICSGGLAYGHYFIPRTMARRVEAIRNMLNEYIRNAYKLEKQLSNVSDIGKKIDVRYKHLYSHESVRKIRSALGKISEYLDNYVDEGRSVVVEIENVCCEFFKK